MSVSTPGCISDAPYRRSGRSDWPASLAAQSLRKAFLTNLALPHDPDAPPNQPLSEKARYCLALLHRAIINPTGRARTEQWLDTFGKASKPLWDEVWSWGVDLDADHRAAAPLVNPDDARWWTLLRLFQDLLGVAVMRPIIGSLPQQSSIYYAAIDHRYLEDDTRQLILDSVVVPPGRGSVGRCVRKGENCVGISFGDYAGVVEWQDWVQGQVSILMVADRAGIPAHVTQEKITDPDQNSLVNLVLMAFFPVAYVFSHREAIPEGPIREMEVLRRADEILSQSLKDCLKDHTLRDTVGALTEYQDLLRRNRQFQSAIPDFQVAEGDLFAATVVNLLIPERFTDLPVPLNAAVAITASRNSINGDDFEIAHLRVTPQALEDAIEVAASAALSEFLVKEPLPTPLRTLATLFPENAIERPADRQPLFPCGELNLDHLVFLPRADEDCEAVWWIHTSDGSGWPRGARECAERIHKPLHSILQVIEKLAGWEDGLEVEDAWHHTLPLFAEFKLRDNLVDQYYSLVSRVLFIDAGGDSEDAKEQARQLVTRRICDLRSVLETCSNLIPLRNVQIDPPEIEAACDAVCALVDILTAQRDPTTNPFLGATSFVRVRHRLRLAGDDRTNPSLRLIHLLQIQKRLFGNAGPKTLLLEDGNETLTLESLADRHIQAMLGDKRIQAAPQNQFVVKTDLHAGRAHRWTTWIKDKVGRGYGISHIEDGLRRYLGSTFRFTSLDKSDCTNIAKQLQAELWVAFQNSREEGDAQSLYKEKLRPIARLFCVTMQEQYRFGRAQAAIAEEQGRAKEAEQLVGGTAHTLKIPIQVAQDRATEEAATRTTEVLALASGFVTIGAYIQKYRKDQAAGKKRSLLTWVRTERLTDPAVLTLTRPSVSEWVRLALDYVSISKKHGSAGKVVKRIREADPQTLLQIVGLSDDDMFQLAFDGRRPVLKERTDASVFRSAFIEVSANAIANADPDEPLIIVDLSVHGGNSQRDLIIAVENSVHRNVVPWESLQDFDRHITAEKGIVGILMARWACEALGWQFDTRKIIHASGRVLQRVEFRARFS